MPKRKITLATLHDQMQEMATKADLSGLATKADLSGLATKAELSGLATKAELSGLATKADLSGLATKAELSGLATKAELSGLATKDDLSRVSAKVDALTDWVRNGFHDVNAQLGDLRTRVDTLHGLMENLLVRVERLEQEYTMIIAGLKRLEFRFDQLEANRLKERIEALEKRVTALESVEN